MLLSIILLSPAEIWTQICIPNMGQGCMEISCPLNKSDFNEPWIVRTWTEKIFVLYFWHENIRACCCCWFDINFWNNESLFVFLFVDNCGLFSNLHKNKRIIACCNNGCNTVNMQSLLYTLRSKFKPNTSYESFKNNQSFIIS